MPLSLSSPAVGLSQLRPVSQSHPNKYSRNNFKLHVRWVAGIFLNSSLSDMIEGSGKRNEVGGVFFLVDLFS